VHRAGHCTFTPAETVSAFQTLVHRMKTGHWDDSTKPSQMNAPAASLGPGFNTLGGGSQVAPAFIDFKPSVFLRPFDARDVAGGEGHSD
jgi:hypothetical protein